MKKPFIFLCLLSACGIRDTTPKDTRPAQLQGTWISMTVDGQCHERIVINPDNSFSWDQITKTDRGSYRVLDNKIEFMYSEQYPNIFQYSVDNYNLILKKLSCDVKYIRIPKESNAIENIKYLDTKNCWSFVGNQQQQQQKKKDPIPTPTPEPTPEPTPTPTPCPDCPPCPECPPCPPPTPTPPYEKPKKPCWPWFY